MKNKSRREIRTMLFMLSIYAEKLAGVKTEEDIKFWEDLIKIKLQELAEAFEKLETPKEKTPQEILLSWEEAVDYIKGMKAESLFAT